MYACFPETWFTKHEPAGYIRSPPHIRAARFAKRLLPWFTAPGVAPIKASLKSDPNKLIGVAGWYTPEFGRVYNMFRYDAIEKFGVREKLGWTEQDVKDMWEDVNTETSETELITNDDVRQEEMGDKPHW